MGLFERFAMKGVYLQVFMIAAGSLLVLRAPFENKLSSEQIETHRAGADGYCGGTRVVFSDEAGGS
jgi:hypothetical protein